MGNFAVFELCPGNSLYELFLQHSQMYRANFSTLHIAEADQIFVDETPTPNSFVANHGSGTLCTQQTPPGHRASQLLVFQYLKTQTPLQLWLFDLHIDYRELLLGASLTLEAALISRAYISSLSMLSRRFSNIQSGV